MQIQSALCERTAGGEGRQWGFSARTMLKGIALSFALTSGKRSFAPRFWNPSIVPVKSTPLRRGHEW